MEQKAPARKPPWLNKRISIAQNARMKSLLSQASLHTICEEALCPNISECFARHQASFLILGAVCTRGCRFCNVTHGTPPMPDTEEPLHLAETVVSLALSHVVVTSPTRDDLDDGGAAHYARCTEQLRRLSPETRVELLVPDFKGNAESLRTVLANNPDILGHNLETVRRLYAVRRGADYDRSLRLLEQSVKHSPHIPAKSGIMVGLGERADEVRELFDDLRAAGCTLLSIGQYLAPRNSNYPVQEYITPEMFKKYRVWALEAGFDHVESSPYVRSSYHADEYLARSV